MASTICLQIRTEHTPKSCKSIPFSNNEMAEPVVSFMVQKLGDFLLEEGRLLSKVASGDKVRRLEKELRWMQCFLKDADAKQDQDERVRNWVAEIRDLAYDAGEIIETFDLTVMSKKRGGLKKINSCCDGITLHKLGSDIDQIIGRVNELITTLQAYGVRELKGGDIPKYSLMEKQQKLRKTYSHVAEEDVVGLEEDRERILRQLIGEQKSSHVISICGMGGLGKTTLAKEVYHDENVRSHFTRFAWAYISQQFNTRDVWEGILIRLRSPDNAGRERISKLKDDELAKELYKVQLEKRCLIVLDDIWSEDAWESLHAGFPAVKTSSKILLTSRNVEVALHVDPNGFIHQPRLLNEQESWELFMRKAILGREETGFIFDTVIEELGREMVKKCGGLPLAIKVLGGILATKTTFDEWNRVHNDVRIHLRGKDEVKGIFGLSYSELPYHLKLCFLQFAHYQEDYMIPARKVIDIWVAEGFIPSSREGEEIKEMEDIAQENLEELVSRCMVQPVKRSSTGRIKSCNLHDIMQDLCIQQAKREGFIQFLQNEDSSKSSSTVGKVRRLSLHWNGLISDNSIKYENYAHIRSLMGSGVDGDCSMLPSAAVSMAKSFKLLKVLDLEKVQLYSIPEQIGDLIQLRLLDISSAYMRNLPSSIGKLNRLLTLRLYSKHARHTKYPETEKIPVVIGKLTQLRHLYLPIVDDSVTQSYLTLSKLSNLLTLVNYPISHGAPEDIVRLRSLRTLKMKLQGKDRVIFQRLKRVFRSSSVNTFTSLRSLSVDHSETEKEVHVKQLALLCPNLNKLHLVGKASLWGVNANEHLDFFQNLTKLSLRGSSLSEDPMPALGQLPSLTVLIMEEKSLTQELCTISCPRNSFPRLHSLALDALSSLQEWTVEEAALRCLVHLKISSCSNLKMIPEGLISITSLRELEIKLMPKQFTDRLKRGGHDFYKIQHVPVIRLLEDDSKDGDSY